MNLFESSLTYPSRLGAKCLRTLPPRCFRHVYLWAGRRPDAGGPQPQPAANAAANTTAATTAPTAGCTARGTAGAGGGTAGAATAAARAGTPVARARVPAVVGLWPGLLGFRGVPCRHQCRAGRRSCCPPLAPRQRTIPPGRGRASTRCPTWPTTRQAATADAENRGRAHPASPRRHSGRCPGRGRWGPAGAAARRARGSSACLHPLPLRRGDAACGPAQGPLRTSNRAGSASYYEEVLPAASPHWGLRMRSLGALVLLILSRWKWNG